MLEKFIPTYCANNIYEIDINFYKKNNFNVILFDLDYTLDSFWNKIPSDRTINLINEIKKNNIRVIIISNNLKNRVVKYSTKLNIDDYIYLAFKPFKKKILKKLLNMNVDFKHCLLIGDKITTDILFGNKIKINTLLLTERFKKITAPIIDKYIYFLLKKKNKIHNWKEYL